MNQWARSLGIEKVKMLPDGNGEIEQMFIEEGASDNCPTDPFSVSQADTLLAWIRGKAAPQEKPDQRAFIG